MATENTNLIELLLHLIQKVPYLSEVEHEAELDLLRAIEKDFGVEGVVPPAPVDTNVAPTIPVVDPGPVAEPVPPDAQPPVPTSPEVAETAPEATNAFSGTDPNAAPA